MLSPFCFPPQPTSKKDYFGEYISINNAVGFTVNGDAYGYFLPAKNPLLLFHQGEVRQSRPLFIILGTAVGYPFYLLLTPFGVRDYYAFYLGFVLLNMALLYFSLVAFEKLLPMLIGRRLNLLLIIPLEIILLSNQVTKAFVWTIHQQMFGTLTPLLTIYGMSLITARGYFIRNHNFTFLLAGTMFLLYGSFILMLPLFLYADYVWLGKKLDWKRAARHVLYFVVPTLAWVGLLRIAGVKYFNYEMHNFRQLVWITDTLRQSVPVFFNTLLNYSVRYMYTFKEIMLFVTFIIWLRLLVQYQKDTRRRISPYLVNATLRNNLFAAVIINFVFFWLLGYYAERLTFNLFPIFLCVIIYGFRFLPSIRFVTATLWATAIAWHFMNLFSYGPFG